MWFCVCRAPERAKIAVCIQVGTKELNMGNPQKAVAYIEIEDYLVLEEASQYKHEYLDGVIYAIQGEPMRGMAGGSQAHVRLIRNATIALHSKLQGSGCEALASDMRLRISDDAVFYPDVLVHCDSSLAPVAVTELTDAKLVLEVLSPTTQHFDRGAKLQSYQQLPGLMHILLLSGMRQEAWACQRGPDGLWSPLEPWTKGSTLQLPSLEIALDWEEVYGGVGLS